MLCGKSTAPGPEIRVFLTDFVPKKGKKRYPIPVFPDQEPFGHFQSLWKLSPRGRSILS